MPEGVAEGEDVPLRQDCPDYQMGRWCTVWGSFCLGPRACIIETWPTSIEKYIIPLGGR